MILYFYHNLSYTCYYLLHIDDLHDIFLLPDILTYTSFFKHSHHTISVNDSNFTSVFLKAACHPNPTDKKFLKGLNDKDLNKFF